MELVKLVDKRDNSIIEVKKTLAGDYIGTGKYEIFVKKEEKRYEPKPRFNLKEE